MARQNTSIFFEKRNMSLSPLPVRLKLIRTLNIYEKVKYIFSADVILASPCAGNIATRNIKATTNNKKQRCGKRCDGHFTLTG